MIANDSHRKAADVLAAALDTLMEGFSQLPPFEPDVDWERTAAVLQQIARRMQDNYPYFHPLYAGQMLKPPEAVAALAYALAMWINPNNHALDGGRASSAMEKEAVSRLAGMFGWRTHLGHLTGGGTMANLEALWIAGRLHPGRKIAASSQAHYTHSRICDVLQLPFTAIGCDDRGRMDPDRLEAVLRREPVGTVVATMGTTATGAVDPLPRLLELQTEYGFRLHADAAYGGYFTLVPDLASSTRAALECLERVDSLVVDPHKHGLQPYGCGCVLFRDPAVGRFYKHDSPYTYFSSDALHLGEISLECSRPGAAAVALWATQQIFPPVAGGELAARLQRGRQAASQLHQRLDADPRFLAGPAPELDIVIWAPAGRSAAEISERSQRFFENAARSGLHLAVARLPRALFDARWPGVAWDRDEVACLRSCLMKPEHLDWLDAIYRLMDAIADSES